MLLVGCSAPANSPKTEPIPPSPPMVASSSSGTSAPTSGVAPDPAAPSATSSAAPTASPEAARREAQAAEAIAIMTGPNGDPRRMGLMAAAELSERDYGLPVPIVTGLDAIASTRIDPSQRMAILAAMLSESPCSEALASRCGVDGVLFRRQFAAETLTTQEVLQKCEVDAAMLDGHQPHPVALLTGIVVLELLGDRGEPMPSEIRLAQYLIELDSS